MRFKLHKVEIILLYDYEITCLCVAHDLFYYNLLFQIVDMFGSGLPVCAVYFDWYVLRDFCAFPIVQFSLNSLVSVFALALD